MELYIRSFFAIWLWLTALGVIFAVAVLKESGDHGNFFDLMEWSCWLGLSFSMLTYMFDFQKVDVGLTFQYDGETDNEKNAFKYVKM